tara:strand:+ start:2480 stop:3148 length:669 start_codon:yes stop_codon:yes gene_type:complete
MLSRREFVGGSISLSAAAIVGSGMALPARADHPVNRNFTVLRDGSSIGAHSIMMAHNGDEIVVDVEVEMAVKIAFITVFRLEHRNRETWRHGRLVKIDTKTNDNGKDYKIDGTAKGSSFELVVNDELSSIPSTIIPTSYWNAATVGQTVLLNSVNGKLLDVAINRTETEQVKAWYGEVLADKYEMRGDLDLDLWYDADKHLVRLAFESRDSLIEYDLTGGTI